MGTPREIGEDGQVTLRLGRGCDLETALYFKSEMNLFWKGNLVHKLIGDTLHIEGKYKAVKE
jgi:hypothetical protein